MKFIKLETKINLIFWSVILGVVFYFIDIAVCLVASLNQCTSTIDDAACSQELAKHYLLFFQNQYLNALFWILIVFIILSVIRYFKLKKA